MAINTEQHGNKYQTEVLRQHWRGTVLEEYVEIENNPSCHGEDCKNMNPE